MLQTLAHDAVGEDIKGKLLFTVQVGSTGHTQITGSNCVDHIFACFGNFTDKVDKITADILITQVLAQINLKFGLACLAVHTSSELNEMSV
ncbi:MAG: hypothetical protein PVSMB11_04830 [Desulfuromonadaceae bacterium]